MIEPPMDIKGLQLESRFSLPPNSLGYCGRQTAPAKFKKCIRTGECDGVEEEVTKFIVLHPYLRLLSEVTGLPFLSQEIVECYWLGNDLMEKVQPEHYDILLDKFLKQGVPDFLVEDLRANKPKKFIPTHLFQVLHVGVGKTSGAVPFNIQSINNCMIRWGKVIKVNDTSVDTALHSLEREKPPYGLTIQAATIPFASDLVPDIKPDDVVAVHWNMVIKKLTDQEQEKIAKWTKIVLASLS